MRPLLPFVLLYLCFTPAFADDSETPKLLPIPDKLVVLTFDDCNKSDRTFVAEVAKEHAFGATFYITEGLGFLKSKKNYMSKTVI